MMYYVYVFIFYMIKVKDVYAQTKIVFLPRIANTCGQTPEKVQTVCEISSVLVLPFHHASSFSYCC